MGLFSFLTGKNTPPKPIIAHEIRKDVLHWKVGDSLLVKRKSNRRSLHGLPPSPNFYIFKGFPNPTHIAIVKARPLPGTSFIEDPQARVETRLCRDFLPHIKNYSHISRQNDKHEKEVIEATKSSSYQKFIETFQREYKNEMERDMR